MIDLERVPGPVVLRLPAEIDMTNAERVGEELCSAFTRGAAVVIADLTSTVFCDCAGARQFVLARNCADAHDAGIDIATNGSRSAVERARTALETANAYPAIGSPLTLGELSTQQNSVNNAYQQLADMVILTSLPIAGCTLAAATAAGLADRKRPFSLLRLTGARLGMLRRVVALESAVPLLTVAVVSIGFGFAASAMFASVQLQHPLVTPGAGYFLITAAGIAASFGIVTATFPLLRRITGPETARNE